MDAQRHRGVILPLQWIRKGRFLLGPARVCPLGVWLPFPITLCVWYPSKDGSFWGSWLVLQTVILTLVYRGWNGYTRDLLGSLWLFFFIYIPYGKQYDGCTLPRVWREAMVVLFGAGLDFLIYIIEMIIVAFPISCGMKDQRNIETRTLKC